MKLTVWCCIMAILLDTRTLSTENREVAIYFAGYTKRNMPAAMNVTGMIGSNPDHAYMWVVNPLLSFKRVCLYAICNFKFYRKYDKDVFKKPCGDLAICGHFDSDDFKLVVRVFS